MLEYQLLEFCRHLIAFASQAQMGVFHFLYHLKLIFV